MEVRRDLQIASMSRFMEIGEKLELNAFKHLSQAYATTQSEFVKRKLGECAHVIVNIDLSKMNISAMGAFDQKVKNWLSKIQSFAEEADGKVSPKSEQQINAMIQNAEKDLQEFVNVNSVQLPKSDKTPNDTNLSWTTTVQQARLGHKIPKDVSKNLPVICQNVFLEKIEILKQRIPREQLGNLREEVNNFSSHLLDAAMVLQSDGNYDARMRIICLDVLVDDVVLALENKFNPKPPHQETPPRIERVGEKFVLQQEVPIEHLCLRGGGGKGFGYAGTLEALTKAGKLDQLKAVSGSSAGAIAAVAVGFGTPPQKLGGFCDAIQAGVGKAKSKEAIDHYPAIKNIFSGIGAMGNAAGVIQAIDVATAKNTSDFLKNPKVQEFLQKNPGNIFLPHELRRLSNLTAEVSFPREESAMVTFKDLELLGRIRGDGIENNFKEITLTGWDATDGKEIYFNAKNTPDLPIAYATRISMALPGAFKAVEINLTKYQPGGMQVQSPHTFMDGGLGSNSPNEVFIKPLTNSSPEEERVQHQRAQASTLSCVFDEGGKAFAGDSSQFSSRESPIVGFFLRLLGAIKSAFHMNRLRNDENKKLNDSGNIMIVGHGQLGTLSMSPTEEERNAVDLMSNLMAVDWMRQQGEGEAQIESVSLAALLQQLSLENLRQVQTTDEDIRCAIEVEIIRRGQTRT